MAATGADVSVVFVPAAGTKDAVTEAIEARIPLCIVITEGVPVHDTAEFWARASAAGNGTRIIGPNCPRGVASPGQSNAASSRRTSRPRAGSAWSPSPAR